MRSTAARIRRAVVAFASMVPLVFMAQVTTGTGVAEARCGGQGHRIVSQLVIDSTAWVTETPNSGTCDGLGDYYATMRSSFSGWRASVWIQNGGVWTPHYGGFGTGTYNYSYSDANSYSYMHLCLDNGAGTWYCGWGSSWANYLTHSYYGVNSGF